MSLEVWGVDRRAILVGLAETADIRSTSVLPSPPQLDGHKTVAAQAVAIARSNGLSEPPELADVVVDLLDAEGLLDKTPWHFSRGERQAAGLILTFARSFTRLILIDPLAGLDARRARAMSDFIVELSADIRIDVASSHPAFVS